MFQNIIPGEQPDGVAGGTIATSRRKFSNSELFNPVTRHWIDTNKSGCLAVEDYDWVGTCDGQEKRIYTLKDGMYRRELNLERYLFVEVPSPPNSRNGQKYDTGKSPREELRSTENAQPRPAEKQFVPPKNLDPKLIIEPTVAPQLAQMPRINLLNLGDPNGVPGQHNSADTDAISSGGGGQHNSVDTGAISSGGGGVGGGVFHVGGGVTPPRVLERVEPQYSQEARKARYQGTVVLEVIVRKDGTVDIMRIVRSLGFGLDENAIQALKQWRFKPGMRNGVPVDVALNVEVNFNLR